MCNHESFIKLNNVLGIMYDLKNSIKIIKLGRMVLCK